MAKNCLRITPARDTIQLSWQRGQAAPRFADVVEFEHPFNQQALTDLRWYLEEYLRFPYGLAPDNAAKIEQLQNWGQQLFELVFRSSEKAREFFQAATYDGLHKCELVITSDDPTVLNLPWELLYSTSDAPHRAASLRGKAPHKGDRQFLAPTLAGMSRSLSEYAVRPWENRQLVMDEQKNFHLYRHLIHPDVPQMGFVGYSTSFFSQLTSEVGSWWLLEYVQGNLVLPELSQMYQEIDAELDWIKTKLSYSTVSGACIVPFSLRYFDPLMEDMGATSQHSVWKGIPEIIKPVNPSLYNQLRKQLKAQNTKNVNVSQSNETVVVR